MASIALTTSRFPTRIRIRCTRVPRTMDAVYVIFIAFIYRPSRPHPHPIRIPALYSTVFATLSCTTPPHVRLRVYSPHAPSLAAPHRWWGRAAPFAILYLSPCFG